MSAELQASRRDAALILTLSNPGRGNALDGDMCAAAIETLATAERDPGIGAVVLTGAAGSFCAGTDIPGFSEGRARHTLAGTERFDRLRNLIEAIVHCPKPVIAAVDGTAAEEGFSLALACDFIVAGRTARFMMRPAATGLTTGGGSSWFIARVFPRQTAAEILMLGQPVDAQRLHVLGIVNQLADEGLALDVALSLADRLAEQSPGAVERMKLLLRDAPTAGLTQQLDNERRRLSEVLHQAHRPDATSSSDPTLKLDTQ